MYGGSNLITKCRLITASTMGGDWCGAGAPADTASLTAGKGWNVLPAYRLDPITNCQIYETTANGVAKADIVGVRTRNTINVTHWNATCYTKD